MLGIAESMLSGTHSKTGAIEWVILASYSALHWLC